MSVSADLIVSVLTLACALVGMITGHLRLGGGAVAGTGACACILFFMTGESGLAIACLIATAAVVTAGQFTGRAVVGAESEKKPSRHRAPWLVAFLSATILVASLALGVAAVDWPLRESAATLVVRPGVETATLWALVVLGVTAVLAIVRLLPKGRRS
jgi:hypothetical protein